MNKEIVTLPNESVAVGIGWDMVDKKIDLDLACFVYDEIGNLLDIVYFNNLKSSNSSITHSGDCNSGARIGDDEQIKLFLPNISKEISILIFPITVQTPNKTFANIESAYFRCSAQQNNFEFVKYNLGKNSYPSMISCMIYRDPTNTSTWILRTVALGSDKRGLEHLAPELDATLSLIVPKVLLNLRTINVADRMDLNKGDDFAIESENIVMGLGWDAGCDLDAWCYMFTADWICTDEIGFSGLESKCGSVIHSGDSKNGEAEGDDESISVNLAKVPKEIKYLFFVVKIFTFMKPITFSAVKNSYVRMMDSEQNELCHFKMTDAAANATALVFCKVYRMGNIWRFTAIGEGARKQTVKKPATLSRFLGRPQKVVLTIEKGRNLAAKDLLGASSDPYVRVSVFDNNFKSDKIMRTLEPEWRYQIHGVAWGGRLWVKVSVWDWDKISRDDFMGQIEEDMRIGSEKWFPLRGRGRKKENISGDLFISLKVDVE